jgi:hypothetical protein
LGKAGILAAGLVALASAGTAQAQTSVTLLGVSGHDQSSGALAAQIQSSLTTALSSHFIMVPGDKYKQVAAALGAQTTDPQDVVSVCSSLKLGYLIAGLVGPGASGYDVNIAVRRGSDGQVMNKYQFTVAGTTLDPGTAGQINAALVDGITGDATGHPVAAAPAPAPSGDSSADALLGGATSSNPPPTVATPAPAQTTSPDDESPLASSVNPDEESPLGGGGDSGDASEAPPEASGDGTGDNQVSEGVTLGSRPSWLPLFEGGAGVTLMQRTFTFDDPNAPQRQFAGSAAPAAHVEAAVYPFAGSSQATDKRILAGIGLGGSLDYSAVYNTPYTFGGQADPLGTFQESLQFGLRVREAVHPTSSSVVLRGGLSYGARIFEIKQDQGVQIPNLTVKLMSLDGGLDVPVTAKVALFADVAALIPVGVSDDVSKYSEAKAGVGFGGSAGVSVLPKPWLKLAAAFNFITQKYVFQTRGGAAEQYVGGTITAGILY